MPTNLQELAVGMDLPHLDAGPLTLMDLVRWAGYQENWIRLHYDAEYARGHGMRGPIQSGHHRLALVLRMITDWLGPNGRVKRLALRHRAPVCAGDALQCGGRIIGIEAAAAGRILHLEVWARTLDGRDASEGTAAVEVWDPRQEGAQIWVRT